VPSNQARPHTRRADFKATVTRQPTAVLRQQENAGWHLGQPPSSRRQRIDNPNPAQQAPPELDRGIVCCLGHGFRHMLTSLRRRCVSERLSVRRQPHRQGRTNTLSPHLLTSNQPIQPADHPLPCELTGRRLSQRIDRHKPNSASGGLHASGQCRG